MNILLTLTILDSRDLSDLSLPYGLNSPINFSIEHIGILATKGVVLTLFVCLIIYSIKGGIKEYGKIKDGKGTEIY